MKPRKARPLDELLTDNGLAYHIGQLVGAVEMTAWQLALHDDQDLRELGHKLAEVSGWFFSDEPAPLPNRVQP